MSKKVLILLTLGVLIIVLATGYFFWWRPWVAERSIKIQMGEARSLWPWQDYTQEELGKMYPQIRNADVATTITPEETYAKFREALRTNNLESALAQISHANGKRYNENKKILEEAYREGKFIEMSDWYPEKIEKGTSYESMATFYYYKTRENNDQFRSYIGFVKNETGVWLIDIF